MDDQGYSDSRPRRGAQDRKGRCDSKLLGSVHAQNAVNATATPRAAPNLSALGGRGGEQQMLVVVLLEQQRVTLFPLGLRQTNGCSPSRMWGMGEGAEEWFKSEHYAVLFNHF